MSTQETSERVLPPEAISVSEQFIEESEILRPEGEIVFPARDKPIDPNEFFTRPGVNLRGSFWKRILPVLKLVVSSPKRTYRVGRLKKDAYDRDEILLALPRYHLGHWEDIASLIGMYPNGKEGHYLLYLEGVDGEVFAVDVHWDSDCREWDVFGDELGENTYRRAGRQVLCLGKAVL